jgi:hypothetical protein
MKPPVIDKSDRRYRIMKMKVTFVLTVCALCCALPLAGETSSPRDNIPQAFFLRISSPGEHAPMKYFISNGVVYKVDTPDPAEDDASYRYRSFYNDADFLEFGESLLKIQRDHNGRDDLFAAYGKMALGDWEKILNTTNTASVGSSCSLRGEKYTIVYYDDRLIQIENATGKVAMYLPVDTERFRRNYAFANGYILFSSFSGYGDEPKMPDRWFFRMYNENLDYIDIDATGDLPRNRDYRGFPMALVYPVIKENKAGILIQYEEWGFPSGVNVTSYLFDFENRRVIRSAPLFITQLYYALLKEQYSAGYPPVGAVNFAQNMFWGIRSLDRDGGSFDEGYNNFEWAYPIHNPDLFREAAELKEMGNVAVPVKKEQGIFSRKVYNYFVSPDLEFFFSYSGSTLTQDSTKTEHYGIEVNKLPPDVLRETNISAAAFLTEGATEYRAENMREFSGVPWVINSADLAGAEIAVETGKAINCLAIGNGFYRAGRPDLYTRNSRPKEIAIMYKNAPAADSGMETIEHRVILDDTYEMQLVPLLYEDSQIAIKILSVYSGTDYGDICVNYIGALGNPATDWWR